MNHLRVGPFDLYPSERRLLSGERQLELGGRAFDLLLVLAENPGRLVTKTVLIERVWPRLVVDENNLPAQVAALRRVLGPGAIRTVPGFGYRLELPVRSAEEPPAAAAPTPHLTVPRRTWLERREPLIGRDGELQELREAILAHDLVTLVGVAGAGKTRLAQEVLALESEHHPGRVAWLSLAPLRDVQHVPSAIAGAVGVQLPREVDSATALSLALQDVPLLLILDNAEHLGAELSAVLATLRRQTCSVRMLITSQAPLGMPGEHLYRLPVLAVPPAGAGAEAVRQHAAVRFFVQRVAAAGLQLDMAGPACALVAEVCRRLDGNALALELAAARVPALGLQPILERLADRFRLLRQAHAAEDPRHSTLLSAFDWSYGLLSAAEQRVFNVLGIFAGSFALESAAQCAADEGTDVTEAIDLIARLVDRSLVTAMPTEPPRYVLAETARYYALDRLGAAGAEAARQRLAETTLQLLDRAYEQYWELDEAIWLARFGPDLDNVRLAIDWASRHDPALAVSLYGSAWPLFVEMDLEREGRRRFEQVVTQLSDALPPMRLGRFWEAVSSYESLVHCDRARYAAELAATQQAAAGHPRGQYYALALLALNLRGDQAAAHAACDAALALEDPAWPVRLLALGAMTVGALATADGRFPEARDAYAQAMRHAVATSERLALAATVCIVELDVARGDTAAALQLARPLLWSLRHSGRRETLFDLLAVTFTALLLAGELTEARDCGAELLALGRRIDVSKLYAVLDAMAYLACLEGRMDLAARIVASADQALRAHGLPGRRPAGQRIHATLTHKLKVGGPESAARGRLDELTACALALGLQA